MPQAQQDPLGQVLQAQLALLGQDQLVPLAPLDKWVPQDQLAPLELVLQAQQAQLVPPV